MLLLDGNTISLLMSFNSISPGGQINRSDSRPAAARLLTGPLASEKRAVGGESTCRPAGQPAGSFKKVVRTSESESMRWQAGKRIFLSHAAVSFYRSRAADHYLDGLFLY
jgi:hypothetical protein